jgi:hypothetical protein
MALPKPILLHKPGSYDTLRSLEAHLELARRFQAAALPLSGHFRNGRWVRPHFRNTPGTSRLLPRQLLVGVVVALALACLGSAPWCLASPRSASPVLTHHRVRRRRRRAHPPASPCPSPARANISSSSQAPARPQQAQQVAAQLSAQGWTNVGVLRSDRYPPLHPGYWVTYLGPCPATKAGQAKARNAQQRLPRGVAPTAQITSKASRAETRDCIYVKCAGRAYRAACYAYPPRSPG